MADKKRRNSKSLDNLLEQEDENTHRRLARTPNPPAQIPADVAGRIMSSPPQPPPGLRRSSSERRPLVCPDTTANDPPVAMTRTDASEPDEAETTSESSTSSDPSTVMTAVYLSAVETSYKSFSNGTGTPTEATGSFGSATEATGSFGTPSPFSPLEDLPMDEEGPPKTPKSKQKFFPPDDDKSSK